MSARVNGAEVTVEGCDWAVEYEDGEIAECYDEQEARSWSELSGGKVVVRDVYVTAWAEAGK